jgi:8-amino-7-oxononanoate synthase
VTDFEMELQTRLEGIQNAGLYRELRRVNTPQAPRIEIGRKSLLNFSSNDYLGLANHSAVKEAATLALEKFGAGSGASRLISGSLAPHHELEEGLAAFKNLPRALTFSSGYAAALGTICALVGKEDVIVIDRLVHASIVDAARLSGAKIRVFNHNDLDALETKLRWADARRKFSSSHSPRPQILIITESLFSMDGDAAPLKELVAMKNQYGAWLMLDEAHATGIYGTRHRGLAEQSGVADQIEIQMATLGKALGSAGGFIVGSSRLIDFLVNRARSFIFSTAPTPAAAAAAAAAVKIVQSVEGDTLRQNLWSHLNWFWEKAVSAGIPLPSHPPGPIIPVTIGDEKSAIRASAVLLESGLYIPAIRYPTVKRGAARLRITLTAAHDLKELAALLEALEDLLWPDFLKQKMTPPHSAVPDA